MTAYHVILSRRIDLASIMNDASEGIRPRHAMRQLADRTNATVHSPSGQTPNWIDMVRSNFVGTAELWAFAREVTAKMTAKDVIYCPDETIGLPIAFLCSKKRDRPKVAVLVHNVDRPRTRTALRMSKGVRSADLFMAVSQRQLDFLIKDIGIEERKTLFVADQTDLNFFNPGPVSEGKKRPLVVSAGLEKRDYRILAEATADLDVDVRATGFSADTIAGGKDMPDKWPANFECRRYDWRELAQLYRDADVVAVTLIPNIYAAGITTMVEGMASGCPIVVTRTEGLDGYLDDDDALTVVAPSNVIELRAAIEAIIHDPAKATAMGTRAAAIAASRYGSETHVECIAGAMEQLAGAQPS